MQLGGTTIRVACNQASRADFVNALGGQAPVIPRAGSVLIPCAIFLDDPGVAGNLLTDLGNIVTANCVVRAGSAAGAVLFEQAVAADGLNPGLTYAQWAAGTAAHFTFALTPTDTNLPEGPLFIAVGVTTTSAGDVPLVYCATARLKDYGIFNAGVPVVPDYTSWSKAEGDARYAPTGSVGLAANVTSVGDDAPRSLEQLPSAALALPVLRTVRAGGFLQHWVLDVGTDPNSNDPDGRPRVQRPNDFDATTNPRVWIRYASL